MEILAKFFSKHMTAEELFSKVYVTNETTSMLVEMQCYNAMKKIQAILRDDSLSDVDCFKRIEQVVCQFEKIGSNAGNRHNFSEKTSNTSKVKNQTYNPPPFH